MKKQWGVMRNPSSVCPVSPVAGLVWLGLSSVLVFSTAALHAQCAGGDDPDSLGCQDQQASPSPAAASPASLNIEERPQNGTPNADRSNEASANGSLTSGAIYTEGGLRKGRARTDGRAVPPQPPNAFQNFVFATVGQMLPIYGARLFNAQPTSFGPIDHGPVPGETIIGTDDELRIRIWGQVNFSANLRVSREGEIYIPKVGAVHVAGLPFSGIAGHLRAQMERVYRNFELSVDLGDIHTIQIYAAGMARQPGEYTVSALSTLVDAVFGSGGPSSAGSMRHVELKRAGRVVTDFDLYALLVKGDKAGDVQLQPGDVLYIPPAGPQVALIGSVRQPGIYELRGAESIGQLLDDAGGMTAIAAEAKLSVDRIEDHARRRTFELTPDSAGLATLLTDGDIVRTDPILSIYYEVVTLRGAVANPGRFQWHEGMRLSELMPERDALLKRDYWWQRTRLGLPAPQLAAPASGEGPTEKPAAVESPGAQTNWNYAVIERLDPATMTTSLIPFSPGKLVLEHDISQDIVLAPGDVITIFAQSDLQIPINEQTKYVRLEGEIVHPGIYSIISSDTLRSVVERAGGLTKQSYLYGATFTRQSTLALERVRLKEFSDELEHKMARNAMSTVGVLNSGASQQAISIGREMIERIRSIQATGRIVLDSNPHSTGNYELPEMHLEDGDRLVVPNVPDTIQVIGAVFNPHSFLFHADARVGEYLRLAGGPNRDADRKRIFVLRADGSVTSHESDPSVFPHGPSKVRLHPGDSVVMPEKNLRPTLGSNALAWTQALTGAAMSPLEVYALTK
jgi:protein involved in polysaccharide export with SLBB domain